MEKPKIPLESKKSQENPRIIGKIDNIIEKIKNREKIDLGVSKMENSEMMVVVPKEKITTKKVQFYEEDDEIERIKERIFKKVEEKKIKEEPVKESLCYSESLAESKLIPSLNPSIPPIKPTREQGIDPVKKPEKSPPLPPPPPTNLAPPPSKISSNISKLKQFYSKSLKPSLSAKKSLTSSNQNQISFSLSSSSHSNSLSNSQGNSPFKNPKAIPLEKSDLSSLESQLKSLDQELSSYI